MEVKDFEKKIGALTIMEVTGRVTGITKCTSKSGKPYWKVAISGNEHPLFAWSFGAITDIQIGSGARIEVEQRGDFLNVIKSEPTSGPDDLSEPEPPAEKVKSNAWSRDSKDNPFITRMSALKTAVDYFNLRSGDGTGREAPSIEEVIAIATRLVEFVETGE
jgi:hypothetical protein